ncbi:MAG: hemolysin family protein [Candidatus Latescibacterota bacterium]
MTEVLVIAALLGLNALFVAAEFAIIGAPRAALEHRASSGQRAAARVLAVLREPRRQDQYIATAQLGITVASLGLGMYGEHVVAAWLAEGLEGLPGPGRWLASHAVASALAVALLTYLHIVLGEMVPKSLALLHAERTALGVTGVVLWVKGLCFPLVAALNGLGNLGLRLLGVRRTPGGLEHVHTPEELALIVQESQQSGLLPTDTARVVRDLFAFGGITAGEAMVPRTEVVGIPAGAQGGQIAAALRRGRHTRYPVFEGDLDHITGVVHVKDLLRGLVAEGMLAQGKPRPLPHLPKTATLDQVLRAMRQHRAQLAVVLDEHGGTAGIITLEDLFEEVVGEIGEGPGAARIAPDEQGRLRVLGTVRLDEVGETLGASLEHAEVDTVSGLVLALLGRPPRVGDAVTYQRVRFEVTAVAHLGVRACLVTPPSDPVAA